MHITHGHPRTVVRLGAIALTTGLALTAAGCKHENDAATDDAKVESEPSATQDPPSAVRDYPDFAPQDYTYRLEVLCYCPQVGAVRVTVKDGKVTEAISTSGEAKGQAAPEFARLSINDIIARANDPQVDEAEVTWPTGQDHPSVVALDQLRMATDDEVTYTIKDVAVSGE
ncbi:DUF6174 domain-containing protein [Nocardioides sp. GCM10030258]|uniref:DUF6174 domain-containing protein n=1 Tax=unclassified Nocardioides TaxID=2615069 RepID=UPI0036112C4E